MKQFICAPFMGIVPAAGKVKMVQVTEGMVNKTMEKRCGKDDTA